MTEGSHAGGGSRGGENTRKWLALGFVLLAVTIAVIDNTVLTVSIPRIIEDLDTDVTGAQWVFTGYALAFASTLVIGGRLGDMYGPRRILLIGTALFGVGSLIAALSTSLSMLLVGEAVIEGIGAGLLVPNTMALLARTFEGRQRIAAFTAYATVMGAAAAIGPVLGGYLTTYHSWRWAFGINVVIAPMVMVGLLATTGRDVRGERERLDIKGALLIAGGTFLVVFGLSQGEIYGFWQPTAAVTVAGAEAWPASMPISSIPVAFAVGAGLLVWFWRTELSLERRQAQPLFEFSQFRFRTFRLTNLSTFFLAFAHLGVGFTVSIFLQDSRGLTPMENGLWILPSGVAILVGAPIGGWLSRYVGATTTMRIGSTGVVVGMVALTAALAADVGYWTALPAFAVYGLFSGLVASQITRVLLHDVPPESSGAASGINTTLRQIATALGVATVGAIFTAVAAERGVDQALWPAMAAPIVALAVSSAVFWRTPHIDGPSVGYERPAADEASSMEAVAEALEA
ncbi:MAG TPA: MFS transporter [Acidimicrobiales bacterium]